MTPRRAGRTADNGGNNPAAPEPVLPPDDDGVAVGDQVAVAKPAPKPKRRRPPFGSYMDKDLQREFKARCALEGIEMQDALDAAVRAWLGQEERPEQAVSQQADELAS